MKPVEILAPVGNFECFIAAIKAGCDAVYLGGYQFGARSFASNFSNDELKEVVTYAHLLNVKVYVTVNTLIYESEVETFLKYIDFLVSIHVDALIIQDLGMLDLVHQIYPDLELHASTQMHIHSLDGVKEVSKLGVKRVVLARETDLETVKHIRENTEMELEIFVHGALCVSYSGQCLMSSLIGGRSGNRGTCAGSCRQKYQLVKKENNQYINVTGMEYLLSMKDLNTLEHLGQLLSIGVDSLKIEGRMKRPSYVYMVVSLYKKAVASWMKTGKVEISKQDLKKLKKIFDRGSTKGFLFHEKYQEITNSYRPNHLGVEIGTVTRYQNSFVTVKLKDAVSIHDGLRILSKNDVGTVLNVFKKQGTIVKVAKAGEEISFKIASPVSVGDPVVKTTDFLDLEEIQKNISTSVRKVEVEGTIVLKKGFPASYIVSCEGKKVEVTHDFIVEEAKNSPISKEQIKAPFLKVGDTVYQYSSLDFDCDDGIFVPVKVLNELRREAFIKLDQKRLERPVMKKHSYQRDATYSLEEKGYALKVMDSKLSYQDKTELFSSIYTPLFLRKKGPKEISYFGNVVSSVPSIRELVLVGELGSTKYSSFLSDVSFNVTNSYTVRLLHSLGAKRVTLSYEMNDTQIEELIHAYKRRYQTLPNLELMIYGREEMMTSKFLLPFKYHISDACYLKDRFSNLYPIQITNNLMILYHDKIRKWIPYKKYFDMGISILRFQVTNQEELDEVFNLLSKEKR